MSSSVSSPPSGVTRAPGSGPLPGARAALLLLLCINLFNYIDRQVLAAVVPGIRQEFFSSGGHLARPVQAFMDRLQPLFGSNPDNVLFGFVAIAWCPVSS